MTTEYSIFWWRSCDMIKISRKATKWSLRWDFITRFYLRCKRYFFRHFKHERSFLTFLRKIVYNSRSTYLFFFQNFQLKKASENQSSSAGGVLSAVLKVLRLNSRAKISISMTREQAPSPDEDPVKWLKGQERKRQ